jgi:hypothetical protein
MVPGRIGKVVKEKYTAFPPPPKKTQDINKF